MFIRIPPDADSEKVEPVSHRLHIQRSGTYNGALAQGRVDTSDTSEQQEDRIDVELVFHGLRLSIIDV
jgi:hypothetical protein